MSGGYSGPSPMQKIPQGQPAPTRASLANPNSTFVNGKWVNIPSTRGGAATKPAPKTQSAFDKWLNTMPKGSKAASKLPFNPLAGMPNESPLTTFPGLNMSTLPDGSDATGPTGSAPAPGSATLIDPKAYAKLAGSASFQPIIDALTSQQNRLNSGVAGADSQIDSAYGNAADQSLKGAQIVSANGQATNQSLTDLAARMAQAAGGDPTAAAAVGQSSANAESGIGALTGVAAQTQGDQAAAAARDAASAKTAYQNNVNNAVTTLAGQIGQAKSQGSQAQAKAITDALSFNSGQETDQQNRNTAKQESWLAGQLAAPQITAAQLANDSTKQGLALQKHSSAVNDWTTLNSAKQTQYTDAVTKWTNKNVAQQMKTTLQQGGTPGAELALADPTARAAMESDVMGSMLTKNGPAANPAVMYHTALTTIKNEYPDSSPAAIQKLAQIFVEKQVPIWNSQHSKGQANSGKTWKLVNGSFALVKA